MSKIVSAAAVTCLGTLAGVEAVQTVTNSERGSYQLLLGLTPAIISIAVVLAGLWARNLQHQLVTLAGDLKGSVKELRDDLRKNTDATNDSLRQMEGMKVAVQYTQRSLEELKQRDHGGNP